MRAHESAENYLEMILILTRKKGEVRSIDLANAMEVTKPTVSYMMKRFRESQYIEIDEYGYITLTASGREIAERIYERHTVITQMLVALGVDEATAAADACLIEHDISDSSFDCIKRHFLRNLGKKP